MALDAKMAPRQIAANTVWKACMLFDGLLIALGLVLLLVGGEALVRGASGIALLAKLTPAVVGLTIVAAGTSMPELVVSMQSALQGSAGLALGNVVGSNIFNIACILGITAMILPLRIQGNTVRMEWPVMMLASLQLFLLARDGSVDRVEGACLLAAIVAFVWYAVYLAREATTAAEKDEFQDLETASFGRTGTPAFALNGIAVAIGVGCLAGGSSALVSGAVGIARDFAVSETVIGLTIVSIGTSLPELVTSVVAARRGNADIAVANVIGSNIFNVFGILGATALTLPLSVDSELLGRDVYWMLAISALLFPLLKSGMRLTRAEGGALFSAFLIYMYVLVTDSIAKAAS